MGNLVVVAVRPVHVAVGDFLFRGGAHFQHLHAKAQRLPGQRVVAVQHYLIALDFEHGEGPYLALSVLAFDLAAHLYAWWELTFRNGLQ